jgi:hypothetical protein
MRQILAVPKQMKTVKEERFSGTKATEENHKNQPTII